MHCGIGEYSVKLNLLLFSGDGEVSYTLTLSEDDTVYYIDDTIHHLSYNTNYSINITVVNLNNTGQYSHLPV